MQNWHETPLTFSEILDVTFRILKEHFSKLFLIMLIFMAPYYVLQGIALISGGISLLPEPNRSAGIASLLGSFTQAGTQGANYSYGTAYLVLFSASLLLLTLISLPMSYASLIIMIEQIRNKEKVNISSIIRRAFSRFWALLGGSIVYGLIIFALYIGMVLIIVAYLAFSVGLGAFRGLAVGTTAGLGSHILVLVMLTLASIFGFAYLMTRWSFFFAAIVFEKVSPGLGKSWRLTRGNFWRLVGLYLVVAILNGIILFVLQSAVVLFLGSSILAFLLNSLVSILVMMTPVITYAVIYFDLRVRNEAVDLKGMLETYQGNTVSGSPEAAAGQNQIDTQNDAQQPEQTENR